MNMKTISQIYTVISNETEPTLGEVSLAVLAVIKEILGNHSHNTETLN